MPLHTRAKRAKRKKRLKVQLGAVRSIKDTGQLKRGERLVAKLKPVKRRK